MNVDELLNYENSSKGGNKDKKKSMDESVSVDEPRKRQKLGTVDHLNEEEKLRILKMLENEPEQESFNEANLKKLLNQLEKRVKLIILFLK